MPRLSGVETTAALRSMDITIPIFGVTGNALLADQERFLSAGATKVLLKPVNKAVIAGAVQFAKEHKYKANHKRQKEAE